MKTILLTLSLFFCSSIYSQAPLLISKINGSKHKEQVIDRVVSKISTEILQQNNTTRSIREKINAIKYMSTWLGSTPYLAYTNPIFPDTNVIVIDTSGNNTPWLHGICQTFDLDGGYLKAPGAPFDPLVQPYDINDPTYIDTIWIQGYYSRPNTTTVDTAIISIIADNHGNFTRAFNVGKPDSIIFVIDDKNRDNSPDSVIWTGKIILNNAFKTDTLPNGGHMFMISTNHFQINNCNGTIGVSLEFKPGNNYSQSTDTIYKNQNYIRALYATPQGQNTSFPLGQVTSDVTSGSFCDDNTKHTSGTSYNYYLPPIAFATDHVYQLYDVSIKVYQWRFGGGVNELKNEAKLFQNFPNPIKGNTTIKYSLENKARVSLEIKDVTGKIIFRQKEKTKGSGIHSFDINLAELNSGIYFYFLNVNGRILTKKMIIN